ncbi:uncharacterized protein TNCV_4297531 [Trichonephila clavipes]|nr:uncharacterized protein TNCV_4297531 [Trichonephila clavipes]
MEGILYKGTLARNPRCSKCRGIDDAEFSTPVVADQRTAKCLKESVRSTASKLASLGNCSAAHELLWRDRKILLLESP